MDLDHGEQLVRQGAFSAVDSIVEHGDVVDLQPVGGRDGFRFQPVDLVDHEVDGRSLQGLATEREGVNQTFIPLRYSSSALMGSALSKEKPMKSSRPMPASLRRSAAAASTLVSREQVDVPRGTRVDGSGKHALTALQDKGRIRVAEDAAQ